MNILLLGSGGRECALAWKIKQSPKTDKLYIAPGNAGTAAIGTNVAIPATDFDAIGKFAVEKHIDMVVVGPEDPLVEGRRPLGRQQRVCQRIHDASQYTHGPV